MGTVQIDGSTPKITVGNATAEDALIVFDGNAQDFYIGLDDSADDLVIGLGSAAGTTPAISINEDRDVTISDGAIDFDVASHDTSNGLKLGGTLVTATAAELNIMDGVTATAAEINLIDGGTARGTTAIADGDGVLINDAGTMRQTTVETLKTYIGSVTLSGSENNNIATVTGANALIGEARLYYDGDVLWQEASNGTTEFRQTVDGGGTYWSSLIASASDVKLYTRTASPLIFGINNSEQMRIDTGGHLIINGTTGITGTSLMVYNDSTESTAQFVNVATTGNHRGIDFTDGDDTLLGSINFNCGGNTVSYETSSDYRLKENITDLTGAITRVKNLKPKRFNFKTRPDETLDGFLAHEVQDVVPEAGSGTKDETETRENIVVNAKGNVKANNITEAEWTQGKIDETYESDTTWHSSKEFIRPQGVDQSKLVPLLTSALQEAITKIETLETKVTALEG